MKKIAIAGCALVVLFSLLVAAASFAAEQKGGSDKGDGRKGRYLVTLGGCNDCHSPKKMTPKGPAPDGALLLSGHPANEKLPEVPPNIIGPDKWGALTNNNLTAWVGPWGTSFASNLSPDPETGTGAWNDELFIRILRTGKYMGAGRDLLPPMPWYDLAKLNDADLKAILAYLKSLKPVKNQVPAAVIAPIAPPQRLQIQ
jgi:mono/diheme cytochrome c family protein